METKSIAFSADVPVPKLLDKHNYAEWAIRVRTYLRGQDLWEDIINDNENENENENATAADRHDDAAANVRRRNFMALHIIQISCGPDAFSEIRTVCSSAHTAWQTLKKKYDQGNMVDNSYLQYLDLYKAVLRGHWTAAREFLDSQPEAVRKAITEKGETALHIAVTAGHKHIVEKLVDQDDHGCRYRMTKEDLGIEDGDGCTALMTALEYGRSELARYLYTRTPLEDLFPAEKDKKGAMLLTRAIYSRNLDLALHLIWSNPRLTYVLDDRGVSPFLALASMPHIFASGNRLGFWKQLIYDHCISIDQSARSTYETRSNNPNDVENGRQRNLVTTQSGSTIEIHTNIPNVENGLQRNQVTMLGSEPAALLRVLVSVTFRDYLLGPAKSIVSHWFGIKQLYEMKKINIQSEKLLSRMCEEIPRISQTRQRISGGVYDAINRAVKNGISEFVSTTMSKDPRFLEENLMNIFLLAAVLYRHSQIYSFIITRSGPISRMINIVTSFGDRNNDNILHMVGIVDDSTKFNRSSGAALQMQRELQWFKEVERIASPEMKECINRDGLTPQQLFTKNHENMMEKGEKWMKDTASSCTVVGALIITIMFAVAFTAPGGNEQTTGFPIFLQKKLFMLFIISDALSLFSSTTSVLMFLGILTSRYAKEDFLEYLPRQMIIGLLTLFCSVATMLITFSSALLIILHDQLHIAIPLICLAGFPVTFFVGIQFPILKDMIKSTYFPGFFNRKMNFDFM